MNRSDLDRNAYMLHGSLARRGYMSWYHSFRGVQPDTREVRTFFIEYRILNPALGGEQPILGQHPYFKKRGMKPSYILVKTGVFPNADDMDGMQLNAYYPISSLKSAKEPFILQAEDCFYSENHITGFVEISREEARHRSFMTDEGYMEWDLEVHKAVSCHTGFLSGLFCTAIGALTSFWHGEGIRTFYRGTVSLNGVLYEVSPETSYGYADKHWGRSFNSPLLRFASGHLISKSTGNEYKNSALTIDGCCPKLFFIPLRRKLFIQLTYRGEDFEFHFADPRDPARSKWSIKETDKRYIWHIKAQNRNAVIKISLSSLKAQMMELTYESPSGSLPAQPLLSGGSGTGTIQIFRRSRDGLQLIDTIAISDALCEYQAQN
ncbi:MAG: hypothetical protein NC417_05470 [Candidatus Gastranaerophilales bacterium]|nr:hypothetical protein [Candidatus Gastranaerophilales bacterium]